MKVDEDYPTPYMRELFIAILKLRTPQEATAFFRDLLTIAELKEFANRWHVVKLLNEGLTYQAIAKRLMISTATVTRVAHWLHHGMGGYRLVAARLFHKK
ncbi:helix-turn-helix domain-containing protein [Candidatus Gottesmanbacteria bacterium]|nr:helix-turn-helix domain-containing protein [Candidatus Gottesmanbacteria bacterium]